MGCESSAVLVPWCTVLIDVLPAAAAPSGLTKMPVLPLLLAVGQSHGAAALWARECWGRAARASHSFLLLASSGADVAVLSPL